MNKSKQAFISPNIKRSVGGKSTFSLKFGKHLISGPLIDAGIGYLHQQGRKAAHSTANKAVKKLRDMTKDMDLNPGVRIGVLDNRDRSLVNNVSREVSYKHTSTSFLQSPTATSRIYRTNLNIGPPSPKSLYKYSDNRTIDLKDLVNTERDYLDTKRRESLTSTFGFNQRRYDFLLVDTIMTAGDVRFLYEDFKDRAINKLATKNYYDTLLYENLRLSIKSEMDYYSIRLKLHLVKITNPSFGALDVFNGVFHSDLTMSTPGKIPLGRQYSGPTVHTRFSISVLTDSKCSLQSSDHFKANAKVVKTFYRTLGPSDIWDFTYYLHYGSGIVLNQIFEDEVSNTHPLGYFFILESEGDPRASITRTRDGQNFNGTSPGRFNYTFKKSLKFIKENQDGDEKFSVREFVKNDEDFEDTKFADYFTPNRESKINASFENVNINRIEDSKLPYQLRYGEGRLTVYMDPSLRSWLSKKDAEELNGQETTNTTDTTATVLDPEDVMPSDEETRGLRGADIIDEFDVLGDDD